MTGGNPLGGKNPNSLYVPMSETEQEFVKRLIEKGDLQVRVHGWGIVPNPNVTLGDAQVVIPLTLKFDRPEVPMAVHQFDLELLTGSGISLFRETQSTEYGGQPLMVGSGTIVQMVWHIAVKAMDPRLIKDLMPGTVGLTSRLLDKDTGELTHTGNLHLAPTQKRLLDIVRAGEARVRADRISKIKPS